MYHPVMGNDIFYPILDGCLSKDNTAKPPPWLWITVWVKTPAAIQLSECDLNPLMTIYCLYFFTLNDYDGVFTAIVDYGATNSFMHS